MQKSAFRKILIVDLDKTLCPVDTLRILRHRWWVRHPFHVNRPRKWRNISKQHEKIQLWKEVPFGGEPIVSARVTELISDHKNCEFEIALVSGSSQELVEWFSAGLAIGPELIAGSNEHVNLTKSNKARFVEDTFPHCYTKYVGDSPDDNHVWEMTNAGVVVKNKMICIEDVQKINSNIELIAGPTLRERLYSYLKLLLS